MRRGAETLRLTAGRLPAGDPHAYYSDSEITGLMLRVTKVGARFWHVRMVLDGKESRPKIGSLDEMDYHQAAEIALRTYGAKRRGEDPVAALGLPSSATLRQVVDQYLQDGTKSGWRNKQIAFTDAVLDGWQEGLTPLRGIGHLPVGAIKSDQLMTLVRKRWMQGEKHGWSIAAARLCLKVIKASIEYARDETRSITIPLTTPNVAASVMQHPDLKARKPKSYKRGFVLDEVRAFRAALNMHLNDYRDGSNQRDPLGWLMLELGLLVGARPGEVAKLKLQWINGDKIVFREHKTAGVTSAERVIELSDDALAVLEKAALWRTRLRRNNGYVFPSARGKGHLVDARNHMDDLRTELGIDWTPHSLRSIYINALGDAGVPLKTAATMIGDDEKTVARHYVEVTRQQVDEAKAKAGKMFRE